MIGRETRITSKLYRVNVKNGANLRDKFAAVCLYPFFHE